MGSSGMRKVRGLLICALVAAAPGCGSEHEGSDASPDAEAGSDPTSPGLLSDLGPVTPEMRAQIEQGLARTGGQSVGRLASLPVRIRPPLGKNNLQWLFTKPDELAPAWQRESWAERMAPLFNPQGHPRAGEYRDGVRPEDVLAAALPIAEQSFPKERLDQPMLHVAQKRIPAQELAAATDRLWSKRDPGSSRPLYEWLVAHPDDPNTLPGDFWLPTLPGAPDATTHREWLGREILEQATEQIAAQKAKVEADP